MTHEATTTAHARTSNGSALLPTVGSIILAVIWGAYTLLVAYEFFTLTPPPL